MDVSTGDVITPRAIEYKYKKLFDNSYIDILSYNKHEYSKNISFNDTIKAIKIIKETIFSNNEIKLSVAHN